jgi:putative transposase
LVLVTKYRRSVLSGAMIDRATTLLGELCLAWEGELVECSGEADHLHVLIDMPPKVRPSDLVNNFKTVLSRRLRKEFPSLRAAYRGKAVLWSPSYCLISAGGAPIEIFRQYVENQTRPA